MDKKAWFIVITTVLVLFSLPGVLSSMMTIDYFRKSVGSADGWLSYWGGYLGAIVGLAAIAVTTQFQINSQYKLHKEQLKAQEESMIKMHESQKEIQRYSIDESSKTNDKKERDRIYTNLLMDKNEELIEILIELNYLSTERFNILNEYVYFESLKRNAVDIKSNKFKENFLSGSKKLRELNEEEIKLKLKIQRHVKTVEGIKRKETEIRMKILGASAKIKSKSMYFSGLELKIDIYRGEISSALEEFYNHIEKKDIDLEKFSEKIESRSSELHCLTNEILNVCQNNLSGIVHTLINS